MSKSETATYKVMHETIEALEKKHNMHCIGTGIDGEYDHLELSFQLFAPLNKAQARELLVDCVEEFLKKINSSEELKEVLKEFPFTYKNVGIILYINRENYKKIYHPDLCVARFSCPGVIFKTLDPEKKYGYKETYEETHEEAFKLVQEYRSRKELKNE